MHEVQENRYILDQVKWLWIQNCTNIVAVLFYICMQQEDNFEGHGTVQLDQGEQDKPEYHMTLAHS